MMTQHNTKEICTLENAKSLELDMSSKQPSAIFIELLG
jgi:hypothetical protein